MYWFLRMLDCLQLVCFNCVSVCDYLFVTERKQQQLVQQQNTKRVYSESRETWQRCVDLLKIQKPTTQKQSNNKSDESKWAFRAFRSFSSSTEEAVCVPVVLSFLSPVREVRSAAHCLCTRMLDCPRVLDTRTDFNQTQRHAASCAWCCCCDDKGHAGCVVGLAAVSGEDVTHKEVQERHSGQEARREKHDITERRQNTHRVCLCCGWEEDVTETTLCLLVFCWSFW